MYVYQYISIYILSLSFSHFSTPLFIYTFPSRLISVILYIDWFTHSSTGHSNSHPFFTFNIKQSKTVTILYLFPVSKPLHIPVFCFNLIQIFIGHFKTHSLLVSMCLSCFSLFVCVCVCVCSAFLSIMIICQPVSQFIASLLISYIKTPFYINKLLWYEYIYPRFSLFLLFFFSPGKNHTHAFLMFFSLLPLVFQINELK